MWRKAKRSFKYAVFALVLSLIAGGSARAAESDFSTFWTLDSMFRAGIPRDQVLLSVSENGSFSGNSSYIQTLDAKTNAGMSLCQQIGQDPCDLASVLANAVHIYAPIVMPMCSAADSGDCVESLSLTKPSGEVVQAEFIRKAGGATYKANPDFSFPATGNQLLFRAPGVIHAGGTDTYAVEYVQTLEWVGSATPLYRDLKVAVVPYVAEPSAISKTQIIRPGAGPDGKGKFTLDPWNMPGGAIWAEDGVIGKISNFAKGVGAKVSIRANKKFGGWFRGRLSSAEFEAKTYSQTQQRISIGGESVEVPRLAGLVTGDQFKKYVSEPFFIFEDNKGGGVGGDASDPTGRFPTLEAIRVVSGDKAVGVNRTWMFATVTAPVFVECFKGPGVQGMIATNAAVYGGGAPSYQSGILNYRVGGMHFLPDGSEAIGSYDLVMRSDIARCLYGFSRAPVSATVTITGGEDANVATTTVGERNGWLHLSARGFTFSTKDIQVKLSQKKVSITCVSKTNKKLVKKVTDYAPTCPKGFVKK